MPELKSYVVNHIFVHPSVYPSENAPCMKLDSGVVVSYTSYTTVPLSVSRKQTSGEDFLTKMDM